MAVKYFCDGCGDQVRGPQMLTEWHVLVRASDGSTLLRDRSDTQWKLCENSRLEVTRARKADRT